MSIKTLLNFLESRIWRKEHLYFSIEEELLDFVVMAPWFVPSCSEEREPPSLTNICKAKVAKLKVGLISDTDEVKSLSQISSDFF